MKVHVLGPVAVRDDDDRLVPIRQRRLRQAVCVLALLDGPVSSDELQGLLWETAERRSMLSALTTTIGKLRQVLPDGRIVRDKAGYRLRLDPGSDYLDLWEFRALTAEAHAVRESAPAAAAELFHTAVNLWGELPLLDLPGTQAIRSHAECLLAERSAAIEAWAEVRLAIGQHAEVARDLPGLIKDDPVNEHLWMPLLLALYRDGRKAAALQAYEEARSTLLAETGMEPDRLLTGMRDRIARNDTGLLWRPDQTARESRAINAGIDITVPSAARTYDYLLGGADNFDVDREAADRLLAVIPDLREVALRNRTFLRRSVRFLAEQGVRQFVDVGAGLPTQGNVHQVVEEIVPDARVIYVDNDPMVVAHGTAIIDDRRSTVVINGDVRAPEKIFDHPETRRLIDPHEPVGVLMLAVLHFVAADEAHLVLERVREWLPPGSALVISHVTRTGSSPEVIKMMEIAARRTTVERVFLRSRVEIESLFAGLELVAPLDDPGNWRASEPLPPCTLAALGGIGFLGP
jgi:DNA-binding SARP family transcriptional activator/O-methyltransferase involved in polyketide biosynthesis